MKNKRFYIYIMFILAFLCMNTQPKHVEAKTYPPHVSAHAYVVMDANSGEIIYSENENKKIYPASTAKLMTAVVAMENADFSKKIKLKESVLKKVPKDASMVGLKAGNTYTMEQLMNLMLIASAADAAETLAVVTHGSEKSFIKEMNKRAVQLGLSHTSFDNTVGLDIGDGYKKTYSTASDIAKLARYAMSIKEIRNIVAKKSYQLTDQLSVKSTNQFYSTVSYNSSRYMIIGTKTGTTDAAGNVLVSTARDKQGHEIICAFFGNKSRNSTYEDTRKLIDYTFQCQDKKQISLKLSYYDIRYRNSESTIMKLCAKGMLQIPENGEFHPADKVNQEYFVDTINKICSTNLKAIKEDTYITVKDFAAILYQYYPIAVSGEDIQKATEETINSLSQEKLPELAALYDTEILPDKYVDNIYKCITKEDMIIIAVRLKEYIKN